MTTPTTPAADAAREAFELWYIEHALAEVDMHLTPESMAEMRDGDGYGNRPYLNGALQGFIGATARESALVAERDSLRAALDNKAAILDEIREVIGWEDASPVTTIKRLFAERDQLRVELNKCKAALVTSIRTSQ